MKLVWSRTTAFLGAVALVAMTNAIALGGVAYNRWGEPESILTLTERELSVDNWSWPETERSGINLRLAWRMPPTYGAYGDERTDAWLSDEQVRALGFDVAPPIGVDDEIRYQRRSQAKEVWFVLEYGGPAYQQALERARKRRKEAEERAAAQTEPPDWQLRAELKRLEDEERSASRLFVVDADLNVEALRARYPDRKQYMIVRGRVAPVIVGPAGKRYVTAGYPRIEIESISVPHAYRSVVERLREPDSHGAKGGSPRFEVTVNYGRRLEPWISALKPL